jgi:hypothetical protein
MTTKPYRATSLKGAERRVRFLHDRLARSRRHCAEAEAAIERLESERELLAKLAATGPFFTNPLVAYAAKELRDGILRECGLRPDGKPLKTGGAK